jgi:hypothetical protein
MGRSALGSTIVGDASGVPTTDTTGPPVIGADAIRGVTDTGRGVGFWDEVFDDGNPDVSDIMNLFLGDEIWREIDKKISTISVTSY